jgi:branched-chain amino acid transport system ATP-binding protein
MNALLEVKNLHVAYGKVEAVRGVNLQVQANRVVTIIGANGAGKSSLLNALAGDVRSSGSVIYQGQEISAWPTERRVQSKLCLVPERRELFAEMTVQENLELGAFTERHDRAEMRRRQDWILTLFPRLGERLHQAAGTMSGGEQQMLALGRALMSRPRLLMLDEPSLGLAPIIVREIFKAIAHISGTDMSVLVVEQNARLALRHAHYAYVMEGGQFVLEGAAVDLARDPRVQSTYLGSAASEA